jgi:hypothetical protein
VVLANLLLQRLNLAPQLRVHGLAHDACNARASALHFILPTLVSDRTSDACERNINYLRCFQVSEALPQLRLQLCNFGGQ